MWTWAFAALPRGLPVSNLLAKKEDPPTPTITVVHGASFKERSQMHGPSPPTGVVAQRCLINEGNQSKLVEPLTSLTSCRILSKSS